MLPIVIIAVAVIAYIAGRAHGEHKSLEVLKAAEAQLAAAKAAMTEAIQLRENAERHLNEADRLHEKISSMLNSHGHTVPSRSKS